MWLAWSIRSLMALHTSLINILEELYDYSARTPEDPPIDALLKETARLSALISALKLEAKKKNINWAANTWNLDDVPF